MDKRQIAQIIENFAPLNLAEEWDCPGFAIKTKNNEVKKVMLCLTVTDRIVEQALSNGCDMIISHHPLFCINCHSELVSESFKPNIDVYCAHTNLDRAKGGTTDTIIDFLGYRQTNIKHDFVRFVDKEITVKDLVENLRKISPNLRYVNNKNQQTVNNIAFCAGSGAEFINDAKALGADCYITGDLKFHTAVESDIMLVDLGHFESEIIVLSVFEKLLKGKVETIRAVEKSPFIY